MNEMLCWPVDAARIQNGSDTDSPGCSCNATNTATSTTRQHRPPMRLTTARTFIGKWITPLFQSHGKVSSA